MNSMAISIASNTIDRRWQMEHCIDWLRKNLSSVKVSSIYNTPAVNGKDHDYLNAVMTARTRKSLEEAEAFFKRYETVCGRTPEHKVRGIVAIDIDIVMWNNDVLRMRDFSQKYFQRGWQELKTVNI